MITLPTLYKKTSNGKIQQWTIGHKGDQVVTVFGQQDGKHQTTSDTVVGKNEGKKNETTATIQAGVKAKQLWDKKIKNRYVEKLEQAEEGTSSVVGVKPMLAFPIEKKESHVELPCIVQPKLDGMRCLAVISDKVRLYTRTGKPINTLPHIVEELEDLYGVQQPPFVLDGELYNHEYKEDFNKIISLIKRDEIHPEHTLIEYHIYDVISQDNYMVRMMDVHELIDDTAYLKSPPCWVAHSREDINKLFHKAIKLGYEGAMYRNADMGYDNVKERSVGLLKVKVFDDAEFKVKGVIEGNGKLQGSAGSVICINEEGFEFKAKLKAFENSSGKRIESKEDYQARCVNWLENIDEYKGKMLTVQYQGKTPKRYKDDERIGGNVPRFPIALRIREDE